VSICTIYYFAVLAMNHTKLIEQIDHLTEELVQVKCQYDLLLDWTEAAVIRVDQGGYIQQVSESALKILGFTGDELVGLYFHDTIHRAFADGSINQWIFSPINAVLNDGYSKNIYDDIFWKKDGSYLSVDYVVCPVKNLEGSVVGAVILFKKSAGKGKEEADRIHKMKLVSIGELAAGIAHEINTPIQFIANNTTFIQESYAAVIQLLLSYINFCESTDGFSNYDEYQSLKDFEEEVDVEYLKDEVPVAIKQTLDGIDNVSKLVLGLKRYSRFDGESKVKTDCNQLIENTLVISKNEYKYIAEIETFLEDIPLVDACPGDISQVILNLIVNAAHAIADREDISKTGKGVITISSKLIGESVEVSISDTGVGVSDSIKDRIFDPFFTTKEVGRGTGQGLAISRSIIIDKHNGEFLFTSTLGEGSTFIFRIPVVDKSNFQENQ
jgi:PAS domain S-box-containing protein